MLDIFNSVIEVTGIDLKSFTMCFATALVLGLIIALVHMYKTRHTESFVVTLAMLPSMVTVIILLVNGNIGTGIAVAGAFSLTRFRSQPGTAKEICSIFFAMVIGLACGTGYVGVAIIFAVVVSLMNLFYGAVGLGASSSKMKHLTVVIPENLDYEEVFNEVFDQYVSLYNLVNVKTTNMGSMFKLRYEIVLKSGVSEKKFIDDIRVRNGNCEVMMGRPEVEFLEL